eukprot:TRINITY_DN4466_c2_g1_i3.p1 TRINITY_DN4466_c2_g1~~TRINITY_DN4466_c2_g1_i3.p1  ORF type:complete len:386 (+),score=104.50 TRINITY_DN4466_c2_g1_i3:94-1251(+)
MFGTVFHATSRPGISSQVPIAGDLEHMGGHDDKLASKILRKRQEEMARRTRLLNPRNRACGADTEHLAVQVEAKKTMEVAEKADDAFFAQSAVLQDEILQTVEQMKAANARERHMDVIDFSLKNLRKEDRREYILSDPSANKADSWPDPDDPTLGPSSMHKFSNISETKEMKKARHAQQAQWLQEQIDEKNRRAQLEKEYDRRFDERSVIACHVRAVAEEEERREQREDKIQEAQENLRLAEYVRARNQAKKDADNALKDRHVGTIKNDGFYGEAHDWKVGSNGKLVRTEYKRMSLEEEQDIYNINARQVMEHKAHRDDDKVEQANEAQKNATIVAVLGAVEDAKVTMAKERRLKLDEENKILAEAKKQADVEERKTWMTYDMVG